MGDTNRSAISMPGRIAIIGTGPLSLLKALFLSEKNPGSEITLIDSASQPGGAWYSDRSPGGYEIECGCHIWSYTPEAYRYITGDLGIPLKNMTPSPVLVYKRFKIPYTLKSTWFTYRTFFRYLFSFRFSAIREANNDPNMQYRIFGKKNKYPATGSPELLRELLRRISRNKQIKVMLDTTISSIEVNSEVRLFSGEQVYSFDRVLVTYVSNIREWKFSDRILQASPVRVDYIHFLVSSDRPLKQKLSYWRMTNDPVVHRISDISYQTGGEEHLFLVGIKSDAFALKSTEEIMVYVTGLMRSYHLLHNGQQLHHSKTHVFPTYYSNKEFFALLSDSSEKVEVMRTTDLMHGLYFLLRNDTPHLMNTPTQM